MLFFIYICLYIKNKQMRKTTIKIKLFYVDIELKKTIVKYHEWETGFFCPPCAAEIHEISLDGVDFDTKQKVAAEIKGVKYGHNN